MRPVVVGLIALAFLLVPVVHLLAAHDEEGGEDVDCVVCIVLKKDVISAHPGPAVSDGLSGPETLHPDPLLADAGEDCGPAAPRAPPAPSL